jgi:hypothetical protein
MGDGLGSPIADQQGRNDAGKMQRAEKQEQHEVWGEQSGDWKFRLSWHDREASLNHDCRNCHKPVSAIPDEIASRTQPPMRP